MRYTIMVTDDFHGHMKVNLDKAGNQYVVGLYRDEDMEYTHKTFNTIDEALTVYSKYVEAIAKGEYSYEDRKSWLA